MHGQIRSGKTIRFKSDDPHHKNAIPYKREKYKYKYAEENNNLVLNT